MCGICGIYDKGNTSINSEILLKMRDVMLARGPDDAGMFIGPHIGLGHRRLSILDISDAGHQPMHNEDKNIWIVYNGEIYNYQELKSTLAEKGHKFLSQTDTEVLIHGYEEWGIEGLLRKLNGMFAFAIWNSATEELTLARDRLGIKPLFYMEHNGTIYFSSDIKSIYLAREKDLTLDSNAIDDFLYFYCIPQERSIFKEVKKIPPASYLSFKKEKKTHGEYWQLSFADKLEMSEDDYLDELQKRLVSAVKKRMISDVPIGAFLSGGVDSSLVVAIMANLSGTPVKTFSMGVKEESYNELKYANMVAKRYATDHHVFIADPFNVGILPKIIWAYGEPFADASQIPVFYISKLTKEHVSVALTGDGGDESFCGYGSSVAYFYSGMYRKYLPEFFRNNIAPPILNLITSVTGRPGPLGKIHTLVRYGRGTFKDSLKIGGVFGLELRSKIYSPDFYRQLSGRTPISTFENYLTSTDGYCEVDNSLYMGIKTALPNDYLTKVDVATMMNSLEARSPYLDYELIEFAAKIPSKIKIKHGYQKYLLKKMASRFLPYEAVYRKKWGFGIPVGSWFRNELRALLPSVLLSARAQKRGYFNISCVQRLITEHQSGRRDHAYRLWTLLCLELWHLLFIDKLLSESDTLL